MEHVHTEGLDLSSMQLLITSSDACSVSDYRTLQERLGSQFRIINSYGVTEAAIDSSFYDEPLEKLPKMGSVPIGKAWLNAKFYIVDANLKPVPIGVLGELVIGGVGVARGYLNRPDLTAEKFVESPFTAGERLYRTGDLARWMPDGNVDFIGRIDNQVKIRGYRIELGEIESAMKNVTDVRQALVIDRTDERGQKYLCGFVVVYLIWMRCCLLIWCLLASCAWIKCRLLRTERSTVKHCLCRKGVFVQRLNTQRPVLLPNKHLCRSGSQY